MSIAKKLAFTGLLAALGMVLFRFCQIVVQAWNEDSPRKPRRTA